MGSGSSAVGFGIWHLGWVATQRLRSGTSPADFYLTETLTHLAARIGLTRPVRIAKSIMVQTPVVIGYIRPVILIPSSVLSGLPPTHLEAILAHELAHIRRHDGLINLMQAAVETILFYHPAIWWVSRDAGGTRTVLAMTSPWAFVAIGGSTPRP